MVTEKNLVWLYYAIAKAQIKHASDEKVTALLEKVETKCLSCMLGQAKKFDEYEMSIIRKYVY